MYQLKKIMKQVRSKKKGAILATAGFSIFALTAMAVTSINIANLHQVSVELQNAADASALAGVTLLPIIPANTTPVINQVGQRHIAGNQTVTLSGQDIIYGNYNLTTDIFSPGVTPFNAVQVTARRDASAAAGPIGIFGGGFIGTPTANIARTALAVQDNRINGACIIPYAAYGPLLDANNDGQYDIGSIVNAYSFHGATPEGNYAWLDFDGGSNPTGETREWLQHGFCGLQIPTTIAGNPGTGGASVIDEFNSLLGKTVVMPVYHGYSFGAGGGGNNGTYNIDGLVAVKILKVKLNGPPPDLSIPCMQNTNKRHICIQVVTLGSSDFDINPDPNAIPNNTLFKIRLAR